MEAVPINYWAVLVCALASIALGFAWYGPLFGKVWVKMMGWSESDIKAAQEKGGMWKTYLMAIAGSLLTAFVLAHSLVFASFYTGAEGISAGLMSAFWNWLGFIVPLTLGTVLWEGKSWKLFFLNNGYQLANLLVMGTILSLWL